MNSPHPVVLFDGVCNLCNGAVRFLIRQDEGARLRFASLQSHTGQQLLRQHGLAAHHLNSFVLIENKKAFEQSTAALKLLQYLPWYWQWARLGWVVPRRLRNAAYQCIARNRYRWFGKKANCPLPDAALRHRFLP